MRTIDDALGRNNNFDALRLIAAAGVILSHAFPVVEGSNRNEPLHVFSGGQTTVGELCVAVFFVISGFLITQSFHRSQSVVEYFVNRALRIVPGLIAVTLVVGCVAGPLLTTAASGDYWTNYLTFRYLGNVLIYPTAQQLPGVFEGRVYPVVTNASIWTLCYEFSCYIFVGGLGTAIRRQWLPAALLLGVAVVTVLYTYISPVIFAKFGAFFLGGALAYLARRWIGLDFRLFLFSLVVIVGTMLLHRGWAAAFCLFGTYAVMYLAYARPEHFPDFTRYGDLSYGTYLYAWPVQQILSPYSPSPVANFLFSLPVVLLVAGLSWAWVERPSLARKKTVSAALARSLSIVRHRLGLGLR